MTRGAVGDSQYITNSDLFFDRLYIDHMENGTTNIRVRHSATALRGGGTIPTTVPGLIAIQGKTPH